VLIDLGELYLVRVWGAAGWTNEVMLTLMRMEEVVAASMDRERCHSRQREACCSECQAQNLQMLVGSELLGTILPTRIQIPWHSVLWLYLNPFQLPSLL
jgi:hypothetical protein